MGFNSWDAPAHAGRSTNWAGSVQARHTAYFKSVILSTTSVGYSRNDERELAVSRAAQRERSHHVGLRRRLVERAVDSRRRQRVARHRRRRRRTCSCGMRCRGSAWTALHKLTLTTELARNHVDDRPVVEPVRLVLVQLARRLRGGTAVVVLAHAHAAPPRTQSGHARHVARRRLAAEPGSQPHVWRARRRQPLRLGPGVQSARASRCSDFATTACRIPISFSPRIGFSKIVRRGAADRDRRRLHARSAASASPAGSASSRESPAQSLMSRVISNTGSAERDAAADVRRRRGADSRTGTVSRRSVERAERVRRRHAARRCSPTRSPA